MGHPRVFLCNYESMSTTFVIQCRKNLSDIKNDWVYFSICCSHKVRDVLVNKLKMLMPLYSYIVLGFKQKKPWSLGFQCLK